MNIKSLLMDLAYSMKRLTPIGKIGAMRTFMIVFLTY